MITFDGKGDDAKIVNTLRMRHEHKTKVGIAFCELWYKLLKFLQCTEAKKPLCPTQIVVIKVQLFKV